LCLKIHLNPTILNIAIRCIITSLTHGMPSIILKIFLNTTSLDFFKIVPQISRSYFPCSQLLPRRSSVMSLPLLQPQLEHNTWGLYSCTTLVQQYSSFLHIYRSHHWLFSPSLTSERLHLFLVISNSITTFLVRSWFIKA